MPAFLASTTSSPSFTKYIFGQDFPLATIATIMLPLLYSFVELGAFNQLWRAARRGLAQDISLQTCVALAVCPTIQTLVDVLYWFVYQSLILGTIELTIAWWILVIVPAIVACCAWACCWEVFKSWDSEAEDNLLDMSYPIWMRWGAIYAAATSVSFVVTALLCYFSSTSVLELKHFEWLATFMNFLHAFSLLPQLVLSRRRGFVAPTAVKFLLILGVKHILEFIVDARTSAFMHAGSNYKDMGFLLGDMLSAVFLLDFMYLWASRTFKDDLKLSTRSKKDAVSGFDLQNV